MGIVLPWWLSDKDSACKVGDTGSVPGLGRSPGKPPEAFEESSRDWSLGHAGDEGPRLAMTGESRGCSRAAAPVCGF